MPLVTSCRCGKRNRQAPADRKRGGEAVLEGCFTAWTTTTRRAQSGRAPVSVMNEINLVLPVPATMRGYSVVVHLPVQWGDLDVYGHVNSVVYLKWFEAARAAYAMQVGVEILSRDRGTGAILASVTCNYRRPLAYPGSVHAGARITRVTVGSVTLQYLVTDASTGVPVADGQSDAVLYDYAANEPVAVPERIRVAIEKLEGKTFS